MRRIAITLAVVFALVSVTAVHSQVTVETITGELDASGGVSIDDSGIVYVADFGQTLDDAPRLKQPAKRPRARPGGRGPERFVEILQQPHAASTGWGEPPL